MRLRHKLGLLLTAFALAWIGARAQDSPATKVAQAYGHGTEARQVELPAGATLACDAAHVRIIEVRRLRKGLAQIAARCVQSTSLPVVAWVRSEQMAQAPARMTATIPAKGPATPLIRAGARARLELVRQDMLITMPVICLASGHAGETIRVMDTTGRLRYRARVISADLVRGELE